MKKVPRGYKWKSSKHEAEEVKDCVSNQAVVMSRRQEDRREGRDKVNNPRTHNRGIYMSQVRIHKSTSSMCLTQCLTGKSLTVMEDHQVREKECVEHERERGVDQYISNKTPMYQSIIYLHDMLLPNGEGLKEDLNPLELLGYHFTLEKARNRFHTVLRPP